MTDTVTDIACPAPAPENYLTAAYTLRSWLTTTDHKRIAILYLISLTFFFFVGGASAALIRLELITPQGDLLTAEGYNRAFTLHGIMMVWFFLIPSIPAVFGNFLAPLMVGARDLAFPRLNLLSWYLYVLGGLFTIYVLLAGGVDTGWTFYTPLSTSFANGHVIAAVAGVFIVGFSSILTGLNFIVTIHTMRAKGMTWFRLRLFLWSLYATSLILVLATPILGITLILLGVERLFHVGIFDPALGGDPLLFQHLFWFYSHPAVYIMILPGIGVVSEIVVAAAHRPVFGYKFVAFASLAIAAIGFVVWGHHMFVAGGSAYSGVAFSFLSLIVAVPSAIKIYNWTATLYKADIVIHAPFLFALSFIGLFVVGGLTGLFVALLAVDEHLHDTYFVVAHFHFIMVGASVSAFFGALHFWWPKMTGRLYPDIWGKIAAVTIFVGFCVTFAPQFILGYLGMPRRYYTYPPEFQVLNDFSTAGASILALGYFLPLVYLLWSLRYGARAPANPWEADGLEWTVSSPPPKDNFDHPPVITTEVYPSCHWSYVMTVRAHQFVSTAQQREAGTLGMWVFLATEVMLFGGLFMALSVDRLLHPAAAKEAAAHFQMWIAAGNTAVLMTSSLTMAAAVTAARLADRRMLIRMLYATALLGCVFLGLKIHEYALDIRDGIVPGLLSGAKFNDPSTVLFINLYYVATGLHALHLFLGIAIVLITVVAVSRRKGVDAGLMSVAIVGLYWHFIDIVWIFLYPTLYLVGRGG